MTQKKLDDLQGVGKTIITWAGILGIVATLVLGWDQIGRNKSDTAKLKVEVKANSDYVIEDKITRQQLKVDMAEVKADVKKLLAR